MCESVGGRGQQCKIVEVWKMCAPSSAALARRWPAYEWKRCSLGGNHTGFTHAPKMYRVLNQHPCRDRDSATGKERGQGERAWYTFYTRQESHDQLIVSTMRTDRVRKRRKRKNIVNSPTHIKYTASRVFMLTHFIQSSLAYLFI